MVNSKWNGSWSGNLILLVLSLSSFVDAFSTPSNSHQSRNIVSRTRGTRIFSSATMLPEGILKTISKPGDGLPAQLGDIATVKYSCYLPNDEKAAPFAKSDKQKMVG